jgi:hypothetical protein
MSLMEEIGSELEKRKDAQAKATAIFTAEKGGIAEATVLLFEAPPEDTWSWVASSLADGAIGWVGGQIFQKIFGGKNDFDLALLLQDLVVAVSRGPTSCTTSTRLKAWTGCTTPPTTLRTSSLS